MILLPLAAHDWSGSELEVVLLHELAHIRRGDWATQLAAECVRAVYWFNPLIWLACRRLRLESEQACDDAVLTGGIDGASYAEHLLALARSSMATHRSRFAAFIAPAMARPSSLERRFSAMLNVELNRSPVSRRARTAIAVAMLVLALSIAGFAAQTHFHRSRDRWWTPPAVSCLA